MGKKGNPGTHRNNQDACQDEGEIALA